MIGTALVVLVLQLRPAGATGPDVVRGTVLSDDMARPIAGARIEVVDGGPGTASDAAGAYELRAIGPGTHRLRFAARGYATLALDVLLTGESPLRLDVSLAPLLAPLPAPLAPVRVVARSDTALGARASDASDAGAWRIAGDALRAAPALHDPDPLRLLATLPQAQALPESPAAMHVRGGSADQNAYLLDGAPVYSPVHAGSAPSAFSPDIVDEVVLHGGAPSARHGGHLSSVIDVRTHDGISAATTALGAFGPTALRGAVALPLVPGRAGLLLSARSSVSGLGAEAQAAARMPGTWADRYGKLTMRLGADDVSLSSFSADDGLGFSADAREEPGGAPNGGPRNAFAWRSATHAARWRHPLGSETAVEARLWSARSVGTVAWNADGAVGLQSALRDDGLALSVTSIRATGQRTAGVEVERLATRFAVTSEGTPMMRLASAPLLRTLYVEDAWRPNAQWTIGLGLRGTATAGDAPRVEPRLSVAVRPSPRFEAFAGYARMHQYSQSLRNEESLLGEIAAPDFLVASGTPSVPVAASDELSAGASLAVGAHTRLRVDGYARWMRDLVLVAPATSAPFATDGFVVGDGRASGLGASVERRGERLVVEGHYAVASVLRHGGGARYRPAFVPRQMASAALAFQPGRRTTLRAALWSASGRPTTLLGGDVGWDTRDPLSGAREITGSPQRTVGPLGAGRLPSYLRVDVGARQTLAVWRTRGTLTGVASFENAFDRANVVARVTDVATDARRALGMLPPSIMLGLEWRY